ncbi:MAG: phospholipase D-like domain-containing protein [Methanoregula sp.]|nr:phospholipase D-like domain-containing protein [Methanoregula sp.]
MKQAVAFANNDVSLVAWRYDKKIKNCLGFAIYRIDAKTGEKTALPSWVGFKGRTNPQWEPKDTTIWPVQKFSWNDFTARRGGSYLYEIVPMTGEPDNLERDDNNRLTTGQVDLVPGREHIRAYFNRGILSTQSLAHKVPTNPDGTPNYKVLRDRIDQPGDPLRNSLAGQITEGLTSLLDRAKKEGGECYCALYEFNDPELLQVLLVSPFVHVLLSNAGTKDGTNVGARQSLHDAQIDISDRMLKSGHIGHNKFMVYVDSTGTPRAVLSGSTNWTFTGLCTQSNNAIVIESEEIARIYMDYWNALKSDGNAQSAGFRAANNREIPSVTVDNSTVDIWFSPNTKYVSKRPEAPSDLEEVAEEIKKAEKAVLFLAFKPGRPSIIDYVAQAQNDKPGLFVRGAATDPEAVKDYNVLLYDKSGNTHDTVVAATAITDQFSYWQKELLKLDQSFAIIHDKIIVIDPISDKSVVITGSHNLGNQASYCNDENMLIIRKNRALAGMYAVHVMDVYNHYRWRYHTEQTTGAKTSDYGLEVTDKWQDRFYSSTKPARNDLSVWFEEE